MTPVRNDPGVVDRLVEVRRDWRGLAVLSLAALVLAIGGAGLAAVLGVSWEVYWAQAVPTLAGVVAGLPIALWVVSVERRSSLISEVERAAARKRSVLLALHAELSSNLVALRERRINQGHRDYAVPFLSAEGWGALSAGGELAWLDDPALLATVASAYHDVAMVTTLERLLLDRRSPVEGQMHAEVVFHLLKLDESAEDHLKKAVDATGLAAGL